jgi:diguanylate cyclase (GGDEF)-like protein
MAIRLVMSPWQQWQKASVNLSGALAISWRDMVARYGGEEFVILTSHMTPTQAAAYAETLCRRVQELQIEHLGRPDGKKHLTISVGHATRQAEEATAEELIAEADKALYRAKHKGRDRSVAA